MVPDKVHLVGSVALDSVQEVFRTAGKMLGRRLQRVPDGEPGGRRLWISWQYALLRAQPFLKADASHISESSTPRTGLRAQTSASSPQASTLQISASPRSTESRDAGRRKL